MKKVLIGMMTHNFIRYIDKAILSALAQTYRCDILITDDGSDDGTLEKSQEYLGKNSNIYLSIHPENSGDELRAMEDIIKFSKPYDYAYFFSGDDILFNNTIETLLNHAEEKKSDWTYGGLQIIDEDDGPMNIWTYDGFPESAEEAIAYMWFRKSLGTTTGALFSSRFLEGKKVSRFPNANLGIDTSTAIDWYAFNPRICRVPYIVLKYRTHRKNRSQTLDYQRLAMEIDLYDKLLSVFGPVCIRACIEGAIAGRKKNENNNWGV